MVVYLCGPISLNGTASADAIKKNIEAFEIARENLIERNKSVLDPTVLSKQEQWSDYMRLTIPMVCAADCIALLSGWEKSRGSIFEILVANTIGIPTYNLNDVP